MMGRFGSKGTEVEYEGIIMLNFCQHGYYARYYCFTLRFNLITPVQSQ